MSTSESKYESVCKRVSLGEADAEEDEDVEERRKGEDGGRRKARGGAAACSGLRGALPPLPAEGEYILGVGPEPLLEQCYQGCLKDRPMSSLILWHPPPTPPPSPRA
eukprot:9480065-Pyramimonas_sp.AAC.1